MSASFSLPFSTIKHMVALSQMRVGLTCTLDPPEKVKFLDEGLPSMTQCLPTHFNYLAEGLAWSKNSNFY